MKQGGERGVQYKKRRGGRSGVGEEKGGARVGINTMDVKGSLAIEQYVRTTLVWHKTSPHATASSPSKYVRETNKTHSFYAGQLQESP